MRRRVDLLGEIESGALNPKSDLTQLLRMCVKLGGQTGSGELRAWAVKELKGYGAEDELPAYRIVEAPLLMDGQSGNIRVTGQTVSVALIPDVARDTIGTEVQFRQPLGEVSAMLHKSSQVEGAVLLAPAGIHWLLPLINANVGQYQHVDRVYWSVSPIPILGILDVVRTTLVELVAEMRAGTPKGMSLPSQDVADQAVQVAIHGVGHRVTVNQVVQGDNGAFAARGAVSVDGGTTESGARTFSWWLFGISGVVAAGAAVWTIFIR